MLKKSVFKVKISSSKQNHNYSFTKAKKNFGVSNASREFLRQSSCPWFSIVASHLHLDNYFLLHIKIKKKQCN